MNLQAADTVIIFDTDWNPQVINKLTHLDLFSIWVIDSKSGLVYVGDLSG